MMIKYLYAILLLLSYSQQAQQIFSSCEIPITHDLEREKVVPDVIPKAPASTLKVAYNNLYVQFGNEFTPAQVKFEPSVYWETEVGTFYTITMVDPDAPDPRNPTLGEMLHWLIVNIPGVQGIEPFEVHRGDVIAEYIGSGPPNGTGLHRYIFLAYKQPRKLKFDEKYIPATSKEGRQKFKILRFAEKYELGSPIAGNLFKAQFDNRQHMSFDYGNSAARYISSSRGDRWEEKNIVPDFISSTPAEILKVSYDDLEIQLGNEVTKEQVKQEPKVQWKTETGAFYALEMIDLDPSNVTMRSILHWLVVNIPGANYTKEWLDVNPGEVIAEYRGSNPPRGSGIHRYVFLAYKQPEKLKFDEAHIPAKSISGRKKFKYEEFAKKYNLSGPIAGNFYGCQFKDE